MKKIGLMIFIFLTLFICADFAEAQIQASDFESRYGKPISENENAKEFYVRKNIILKVFYDSDNAAEKLLIFPVQPETLMSFETANEIEEELFPEKERNGKPLNGSIFQSGCNTIAFRKYRNVKISAQSSCGGISRIEMEFGTFSNERVKVIIEEDL